MNNASTAFLILMLTNVVNKKYTIIEIYIYIYILSRWVSLNVLSYSSNLGRRGLYQRHSRECLSSRVRLGMGTGSLWIRAQPCFGYVTCVCSFDRNIFSVLKLAELEANICQTYNFYELIHVKVAFSLLNPCAPAVTSPCLTPSSKCMEKGWVVCYSSLH